MALEHVVDLSARGTDHFATDVEVSDEQIAWREPPPEVLRGRVEEARRALRRAAALSRLQAAAVTDPYLEDLLILLGLEDA
jgi:hypothetical protein